MLTSGLMNSFIEKALLLAAITILPCLTIYRLFFGVDFTDESYWIVMGLRFARGDKPFVDELFINQTGALITLPLIKAFYHIRNGTDGIVLYSRLLYFLSSLFVAYAIYACLSTRFPKITSLLMALPAVLILPLNIPNLGYNSIGSLGFMLGVFSGLTALWGKRRVPLLIAGIAHALSVIAYPPLLIPVFFFFTILVFKSTKRFVSLALYGLGFFMTVAAFLPVFLSAADALTDSMRYTTTSFDHGGGIRKLVLVLQHMFYSNVRMRMVLLLLCTTGILLLRPKFQKFGSFLLLFFPISFVALFTDVMFTQIWFVFYFALLFPLWFLFSPESKENKDLFFYIWAPSFVASLTIGWSSSSAPINGVLGLPAAFIVSALLFYSLLPKPWALFSHLSLLVLLLLTQFSGKAFYRDGNFSQLTYPIPSGPYQGLFTTPEKYRYLEEITRDIRRYDNQHGRIVFYEFPAGYLISSMRPGINSAWIRNISRGKDYYLRYYERHSHPDNIVFEIRWLFHEKDLGFLVEYNDEDALHRYLKKTHHAVLLRDNYTVLKPKPVQPEPKMIQSAVHRRYQ